MSVATSQPKLERTTFTFSRALEYFDIRELQAQTGQSADNFSCVVVKELVDNALDDCENSGVVPEIKMAINEINGGQLQIKVSDNGNGIPSDVIDRILDFNTRTTSKAFYRTPTRGQMGNALKTILGIPFALSQLSEGDTGVEPIIIESKGLKHIINIKADPTGELNLKHDTEPVNNNTGTTITIVLEPEINYRTTKKDILLSIEKLCRGYGIFNPHINFEFEGKVTECGGNEGYDAEEVEIKVSHKYQPISDNKWRKFYPTDLPSPYWYNSDDLKKLLYAHINSGKIKPFGEFLREFRGLSSSRKAKDVKSAFPHIKTIVDIKDEEVNSVLGVMKASTKPPSPRILGFVGKENFKRRIESIYEIKEFWYSIKKGTQEHIPYIVEVAAVTAKEDIGKTIIAGLNFTPSYDNDPFKNTEFHVRKKNGFWGSGLNGLLREFKVTTEDNFILVVHLTYPVLQFTERAKSTVILPSDKFGDEDLTIREAIEEAVYGCCREFYEHKRRKEKDAIKEERRIQREQDEKEKRENQQKYDLKEIVFHVLPDAIHKVSGGGRYPFPNRNLFYVLRDFVKEYSTKKELKSSYSTNLVKSYQKIQGVIEGLYYEARGEFLEPHTDVIIPLGTREVNDYEPPKYLFNKILYIEKRGFNPIFKAAKLREKYDMGIASSLGYVVEACQELSRKANKREKIPIICLHDADADGVMIEEKLRVNLSEYNVEVIDIGLFVRDVLGKGLVIDPEPKVCRKQLQKILKKRLSQEEQDFLIDSSKFYSDSKGKYWKGHRVELNALTPDELIAYIEKKLEEHGLTEKVCPPDDVIQTEMSGKLTDEFDKKLEEQILGVFNLGEVKKAVASKLLGEN